MHALILTLLAALASIQPDGGIVTVKGRHLLAEVARTPRERSLALAYRINFESERCMFVVPPEEGLHPVKTSKFLIAFDVAWLDAEGVVVELNSAVPPCKADLSGRACPEHGGQYPSSYYVFFKSGTLRKWEIKTGDRLTWDLHYQDGTALRVGPHVHAEDLPATHPRRPAKKRKSSPAKGHARP